MTLRRALTVLWLFIPPLALAALMHSTDADIEHVQGPWPPGIWLSVLLWSLPLVAIALLGVALAVRFGWPTVALAALVVAALLAVPVALLQSPRPAAPALPAVGLTLVTWVALMLAVVPAALLGWPKRGAGTPAQG